MTGESNRRQLPKKLLGTHLVEAGVITPTQLEIALKEQRLCGKRLGQILVAQDWVKEQTIEYLIEKVILPERQVVEQELCHPDQNGYGHHKLTTFEQATPAERGKNGSQMLLATPAPELAINLFPKRTAQLLFLVVLALSLASIVGRFTVYHLPDYPLRDFFAWIFDVDAELTIPAIYSASALMFCSMLLAGIAYTKKMVGDRHVRYWGALSIIFLFLSLDEAISIHERTASSIRSALNTSGFLYLAWVIPAAIFVLIVFLVFLRFLAALPAKTRRLFLVAGAIYVGGAIGMELLNAPYWEFYGSEPQDMAYVTIATIEEFLEMLGIVVFIYALLSYISMHMKGVSLRVNVISNQKQYRAP